MICRILEEKKAFDIVTLDVRNKNFLSDHIIIASGTSSRHLQTLAAFLTQTLKEQGVLGRIEGGLSQDWILVDAYDVIVHLFKPEARSFYNLEEMWKGFVLPQKQEEEAASSSIDAFKKPKGDPISG